MKVVYLSHNVSSHRINVKYVIDTAWQSVPYGLYSTKPEGKGCISHMVCDCHAMCTIYPKVGHMCTVIGRNGRGIIAADESSQSVS